MSEQGPSRRIKEDLKDISTYGGRDFYEISVSTKDELLKTFDEIEKQSTAGLRPILHFDMHGSKENGLLMAPSGEYVPWGELSDNMRKVNIATENNLCCVFATCFAQHFVFQIDILNPMLFYLIIAPFEEVNVGFLEEQTNRFYHSVMTSGNITTAYEETLSEQMRLWNCQEILILGLLKYIKMQTKGKGARQRRERLLTEHLKTRNIRNPSEAQMRDARRIIKEFVKPDQSIIDKIAPVFLIGREPGFSFEDLTPFFDKDTQFGTE